MKKLFKSIFCDSEGNFSPAKVFYTYTICQFLLWTIIPAFAFPTIIRDTAEGIAWGNEWQIGYWKHPPLSAWLANLCVVIQGKPGILIYGLSQLCIVITFISVWKLTCKILNPMYAMISVVCLTGIYYYSFPSMRFNPDVLSLPLWAMLILYIYKVSKQYSLSSWIIIGILTGLSFLTKYEIGVLIVPAFIFMLIFKQTRKQLLSLGFLLGVIAFFAVAAVNIVWLFQNNFSSIAYALDTSNTTDTLFAIKEHILNPLGYLLACFGTVVPTLILLLIFKFKNKDKEKINRNLFNTLFIIFVALGPFFFTLTVSTLLGVEINPYWTIPFFSFLGTAFLYMIRPKIKERHLKVFIILCFIGLIVPPLFTGIFSHYIPPMINGRTTEIQYPAQNITKYGEKVWYSHTDAKLKYVVGSSLLTMYMNSYSKDRPHTCEDLVKKNRRTPWIDYNQLKKDGALFIWEVEPRTDGTAEKIKKYYPNAILQPEHKINYLQGSIYEQCEKNPFLLNTIKYLSTYIPFLLERTEPVVIRTAVLPPQ
jgi:hypothetical protein